MRVDGLWFIRIRRYSTENVEKIFLVFVHKLVYNIDMAGGEYGKKVIVEV